jgi:hypothetical protein
MKKALLLMSLVITIGLLLVACAPQQQANTQTIVIDDQPEVDDTPVVNDPEPVDVLKETTDDEPTIIDEVEEQVEDLGLEEEELDQLAKELEDLEFNDLGGLS